MCSTFKFLLAAAILQRVGAKADQLHRPIPYGPSDIEAYAPITNAHVAEGSMPLAELCAAAMVWSDNTAANLLLRELGGPASLTRFVRSLGDNVTRADRTEPTLNTAIPDDPRDTTHPNAMVEDMNAILLGSMLSPASREMLVGWMVGAQTGQKRLRAGLPADWRVGDKTGSGDNASANTIAILYPPQRAPILAAVYYTLSNASEAERNGVHAEIGRLIPELF
jgi:beta-lactamase class A